MDTVTNVPQIELWPLAALVRYARNSRTHSPHQIGEIKASLVEFGFTNPILADDMGIVAGHGRSMAAEELYNAGKQLKFPGDIPIPMGLVPVINCTGWTAQQRRAYIIADNKIAMNAGWDMELLRLEVVELDEAGFDLDLLGFNGDELDELLGEGTDALGEMPELPDGDREPFQQMTFTLHDEQADLVKRALAVAKDLGEFIDAPNENSNGNALARICELFMQEQGEE